MYSRELLALFHSAAHSGALEDATHYGQAGTPGQGPCIRIWLRVADGRIAAARWKAWGCPAAIACSEAACCWSEGRSLEQLLSVTPALVIEWVGGVPEGKEHCPELIVGALRSMARV